MLTAALLLLLSQEAQQIQAPPKGSLAGCVLNAATADPIKGARVTLMRLGRPAPSRYFDTDASGQFRFRELDAGEYLLSAGRQGFVGQEYGARRPGERGRATPIRVVSGQEVKDLELKLTPGGVITGRVLDEDGEPMEMVSVQVMKYRFDGSRRRLIPERSSTTNDLGEYRVAGLAPGAYYLRATAMRSGFDYNSRPEPQPDGKAPPVYGPLYYPGAADPGAAAEVAVLPGREVRGIDFQMFKRRMLRLRGRVSMPDGGAPLHAHVQVLQHGDWSDTRNASAGPDGAFELPGFAPGAYLVTAFANRPGEQYSARRRIDLAADLDDFTLALQRGVEISGTVRFDGKAPAGELHLGVSPVDESFGFGGGGAAIGRNRKFTVENILPGQRYRVYAGGLGTYLQSVRLGGEDVTESGFEVTAAGLRDPLEVTLKIADAEITGSVKDRDVKPVPGATVLAWQKDSDVRAVAFADQTGAYRLQHLRPGKFLLIAADLDEEELSVRDAASLKKYESKAVEIELADHARKIADLELFAP